MDEKKSTRLRRLTALCLGVVFLLVVVAATVYSQTGYVERLPLVTLAPIDWMVVPNEALYVNDDGGLPPLLRGAGGRPLGASGISCGSGWSPASGPTTKTTSRALRRLRSCPTR